MYSLYIWNQFLSDYHYFSVVCNWFTFEIVEIGSSSRIGWREQNLLMEIHAMVSVVGKVISLCWGCFPSHAPSPLWVLETVQPDWRSVSLSWASVLFCFQINQSVQVNVLVANATQYLNLPPWRNKFYAKECSWCYRTLAVCVCVCVYVCVCPQYADGGCIASPYFFHSHLGLDWSIFYLLTAINSSLQWLHGWWDSCIAEFLCSPASFLKFFCRMSLRTVLLSTTSIIVKCSSA